MKTLVLALGGGLALLLGLAAVRTMRFESPQVAVEPAPRVVIPPGAAGRLAGAIRIRTISHEDPAAFDAGAFRSLHAYLQTQFPLLHSRLRRDTVGTHSLLYTWSGIDSSQKPILLAAHLDVVPVESGTEGSWRESPFGGRLVDGFIWGRGAIDNKSAVVGTMEAVEMLLASGFQPKRMKAG